MRGLILVLAAVGCGKAGDSGTPEPEWTGETIPWDLVIEDLNANREGVEVCSLAGCEISDANGALQILLPVGESELLVTGPDILPKRIAITIADTPPSPDRIIVFPTEFTQALWSDMNIDWSKGLVLGQVYGAPGTTVALDPSTGDGPYYLGVGLVHDPDLTSIVEGGGYIFANIDRDGPVEVVHTGLGPGCATTEWSQAGSTEERTKVTTKGGWSSATEMVCK